MLSKLNIPKTVRVGYRYRGDTYTKKLAYVIYYDEKGKLRKETSFEGWRNKVGDKVSYYDSETSNLVEVTVGDELEPTNYENIPTEGFVLNKKVGGYSSGWNNRATYCRVYDPRGFEFEINIVNLLFILQETNSIKGKGLEGEFVYAWDGKDIILLPVGCQEYKESMEFTSLKTKKVTKSEIKEGYTYLTKNQEEVIYLGRHKWLEKNEVATPKHIFIRVSEINDDYNSPFIYIQTKGFTDLASVISSDEISNYSEIYDKFAKCKFISPVKEFHPTKYKLPEVSDKYDSKNHLLGKAFVKVDDKTYVEVQIILENEYVKAENWSDNHYKAIGYKVKNYRKFKIDDNGVITSTYIRIDYYNNRYGKRETVGLQHKYDNGELVMALNNLKHLELVNLEVRLESGALIDIYNY